MRLRKPNAPPPAQPQTRAQPAAPRSRRRLWLALALVPLLGVAAWGLWSAFAPDPLRDARAALDRRDFTSANELLAKRLADNPDDTDTRLLAARSARRSGDFVRAAEYLAPLSRGKESNAAAERELALLAVQHGNTVQGERLFAAYHSSPADPEAAFVMEAYLEGQLKARQKPLDPDADDMSVLGRMHAAADLWLAARPVQADQAQGHHWKGKVYALARDVPNSQKEFRAALAADPDHADARFDLAVSVAAESPQEAARHLERVRTLRPNNRQARFTLATVRASLGELAEARRLLDELLASDPNDVSALVEVGLLDLTEGRVEQAGRPLLKALELRPNAAEVNAAVSRYHQLAGRADEAAKYRKRFEELEGIGAKPPVKP